MVEIKKSWIKEESSDIKEVYTILEKQILDLIEQFNVYSVMVAMTMIKQDLNESVDELMWEAIAK